MPHHAHTHSKASSTSSASLASPSVSTVSHISGAHKARSPHNSIKVLPATPTSSSFPSNIRVVRQGPALAITPLSEGGAAFGTQPPPSPGIMFAKRKRSPFKGPAIGTAGGSYRRSSGERAGGSQGRRSGDFSMGVMEEEEEEENEGSIEEVDDFSPGLKPGEFVVDVNDDAEEVSACKTKA